MYREIKENNNKLKQNTIALRLVVVSIDIYDYAFRGVKVDCHGKCPCPCINKCPKKGKTVCAVDGISYITDCHAACA